MHKPFILVLVAALSLYGCKKKSLPPTSNTNALPLSTMNITYNGKTYHVSYKDTKTTLIYAKVTAPDSTDPLWTLGMNALDAHIRCTFSGRKYDGSGMALGVYKSGNDIGGGANFLELIDYDDAGKVYTSAMDGKDTASTLTVTVSTARQCKGTFNIILSNNGNSYPATGDFDYQN